MCLLAIDLGTSACKASVFTEELKLIDCKSAEYPTHYRGEGCVEQDAYDWWEAAARAMDLLWQAQPEAVGSVAAVGLSGHMLGLLPVGEDGTPLAPSLIHTDTRAVKEARLLGELVGSDELYRRTGNVLSPSASLCKALWFLREAPEVYRKTARFLQSKDYLVYRLTGNMDSTDYSDASHGSLMDIRSMRYLDDVMRIAGLEVDKFPQLGCASRIAGQVGREAAGRLHLHQGTPVVAGGGDGACASVGAGIAAQGDIYCSLGTTAWIAQNVKEPVLDQKQRVFNIASLDGKGFGVFGTMQSAGRALSWAAELMEVDMAAYNRLAEDCPAGSEGLVFLPYLEGERSPVFDPNARGVYFGCTPIHRKEHFLRAVMEGVACGLRSILDIMRESAGFSRMRVIGGGARSGLWKQIIADVCGITIEDAAIAADSTTSLGAAVAAGVGVGMFTDMRQAVKTIAIQNQYQPSADQEIYARVYDVFSQLYPALKQTFAQLGDE